MITRVRTLMQLQRSRREAAEQRARADLLQYLCLEVGVELNLETLLSRLLELVVKVLATARGSIILLDERGGARRSVLSRRGEVATVREAVWERARTPCRLRAHVSCGEPVQPAG